MFQDRPHDPAVPPASPARRSRARRRRSGVAAGLLAVLAVSCTSGSADSPKSTAGASPPVEERSASSELQSDYMRVVNDVLPSVVEITTEGGLGSGVVYDQQGHIVTNAHVVGEQRRFTVDLADRQQPLQAELVGRYAANDLAVIRLENPPSGLRPATFADSKEVEVGQIVLAMGNPLGLSSSVTQGIVSAIGRTVSRPADGGSAPGSIPNMVQTSAAINPGNSGGALVDLSSRVIGINTLGAVDQRLGGAAPGIGFAIPSSAVTRIADQLIEDGRVTSSGRAALGVTVRTVLETDSAPAGAAIVTVAEGGAADEAGLRPGDIITNLGDTRISSVQTLAEALAAHSPGDKVSLTYYRAGSSHTVRMTLETLRSP
ncbi:S1C family serine protease [Streptomyces sp. NPDC003007]